MADNDWVDVPAQDEWQDVQPKPQMGLGDTAFDTYARAGMGAYDALKWLPGVKELANITPGPSADTLSQGLKNNANLGQQVVQGTGQALATLPQVLPFVKAASAVPVIGKAFGGALNPITGMAGYGATTAGAQGQNPVQGAVQGAGQGLAYGAGGAAGSALSKMALNPIARAVGGNIGANIFKAAPTVGSSAGMAAAGAVTAPEGDKVSSGIVGGALGAMNPVGELKPYDETLQDAASAHEKMLNLGKGVIQKVEMKSGKDLNDSYKLAAQNGLIYKRMADNKTDTSFAQAQLEPIMSTLQNQSDAIVKSDPHKLFDLRQLGDEAKEQLRNNPLFKNDLAYNNAKDQIDAHVDAAIENRGQFVDAPTLNSIKQGMWKQSFEPLQPNNNAVARQMGNTAKDSLEKAFPDSGLGDVNGQLGKYLDLKSVLINAHGNTIPNGKLGKGWAGGIGAMTGIAASHFAPNPEIAGLMTLGGTKAGMMLSGHMNDPETISKSVASKVKHAQIVNNINLQPTFNPIKLAQMKVNPTLGIGHDRIGAYGQQRMNENSNMSQPWSNLQPDKIIPSGMPIQQPSNPGALGLPPGDATPQYLKERQDVPNTIPPAGYTEAQVKRLSQNLSKNPSTNRPTTSRPEAFVDMSKGGQSMDQPKTVTPEFNPLANPVSPQGLPQGVKALGLAGAIGLGSMFNPLNNAQAAVKEPERLQLPGDQYTKKEEGFQAHPYVDTMGIKHIGYGFNMDAVGNMLPKLVQEGKRALTKPEADKIYVKLYARARNSAQNFAGDKWHDLSGQQQKALADMSYQMNGKLTGFVKLRKAIEDTNFNSASHEILRSNYAKQAKNRATRNAALIMQ